jgi:hypothetical protein
MRIRRLILTIPLVIFVLAIMMPSIILAAPPLHKVSGGGTVDWPEGRVTYGFVAIQLDAYGNAKGTAHVQARDVSPYPLRIEMDVLYLAVNPDTHEAWIGGVITKANDPTWIGLEFVWRVQDNGEGSKASSPDMTSTIKAGQAVYALRMPDIPLIPQWTNGNIRIQ